MHISEPSRLLFILAGIAAATTADATGRDFQGYRHCTLTLEGEGRAVVFEAVPVADTAERQHQGLSGALLDASAARMLFVWPRSGPRVVWMHDTSVALDVAFIDVQGRIFQTEPMAPNTDRYHYSRAPATAMLELPNGELTSRGIKPGWMIARHSCWGGGKPPHTGGPAS